MNLLTARCDPAAQALDAATVQGLLAELPDWRLEGTKLVACFRFDNFRETMDFATAVAEIAEAHDHHPELDLRYAEATVRFCTHSAGNAVSLNDCICAAQVSHLPEAHP